MTLLEKKLIAVSPKLALKHKIKFVGLFGSQARGDAKRDSDVDLLVDFENKITFIDLMKAEEDFKKALKKDIDLLTRGAIHPKIKKYIIKDLKTIYEK